DRAIRIPSGIPTTMARPRPRANAFSEIHAAFANLAEVTTVRPLAATRLSGGTIDTTPARPTASHTRHHTASAAAVRRGERRPSVSGASPHIDRKSVV